MIGKVRIWMAACVILTVLIGIKVVQLGLELWCVIVAYEQSQVFVSFKKIVDLHKKLCVFKFFFLFIETKQCLL